jgi:hypothetical protein
LVAQATALKDELPNLYRQSNLMEEPNMQLVEALMIEMRQMYYSET